MNGIMYMASFIFYNIQVLPNETAEEIGVKGYKKIFSLLKEKNNEELKSGNHLSYHFKVGKNSYFGPYEFFSEQGGVNGNFIKYNDSDDVTDLLTDKVLFSKSKKNAAVSGKKKIPFVFDAKNHILAIDQYAAPSQEYDKLLEILMYYINPIVKNLFPEYTLTINLLSLPSALDEVFANAISYKNVEVSVFAPNGDDAEDILEEMRKSKMQKLQLSGSSGDSSMISIPNFLKKILKSAQTHGKIKLRYRVQLQNSNETKLMTYDSEKSPLKLNLRHNKSDKDDRGFLRGCLRKIREFCELKNDEIQGD